MERTPEQCQMNYHGVDYIFYRRGRGTELGRKQRNRKRAEEERRNEGSSTTEEVVGEEGQGEEQSAGRMEAAMDLMRRMPPGSAETALNALLSLLPDHSLDLLSQVDLPLQVRMDKESLKEYILCEYNRDADSYRSPWSNKYEPPLEDGTLPCQEMRNLEIEANEVFSVYRDQYYEGGISSVYIWEDEDNGFIACFLIKKDGQGKRGYMQIGSWDAIHVIQVGPEEEGAAHYCLNSTVMLSLTTDNKQSGTFNLSGSIRRQMSMTLAVADGHLVNMGKMIEEMEGKLRNSLDQVYFGKTREMVCTLRPPPEVLNMRLPDS
ncbi:hypothetical protein U9M48_041062 [Paspalum notatum var. saurae]|uniref:F-actin-capping protein subunit beta n=1 Tax=Paspalum notatum var. saurae TaxID=547442 RepID=A0AAQ3XG62_PASNO